MATDKLLINRQSKSANPRATATPSASLFKADMRFPMWSLHALTCHVQQAAAQATQSLRRSLHAHPTCMHAEFWEPVNQPRSFDTLAKRNRTTLVMVRATHRYLKRAQARSRLWQGRRFEGVALANMHPLTAMASRTSKYGSKRTTRAKITCRTGAPRIVKRADVHLASESGLPLLHQASAQALACDCRSTTQVVDSAGVVPMRR